ncbi:TetR/AcrR family transcriptional regulator [Hahella ganghwensis]|uniref:TetR/AcrR family transcriptional regulator n=1 Tax=Hahella ganghwensis TaxID=286420 RepID=UPI0003829251|nr:TetR/AcrR family transcriptional regulator [Hahella ganghwensis]
MSTQDLKKSTKTNTSANKPGNVGKEQEPHGRGAQGSGWRGSADVWLQAAYESLIESGVDAVRIQPLAKQLKLSRTSFYWFFKDREALLTGLLAQWREKNTGNLVRQAGRYGESIIESVLNVFDCWLDHHLFDTHFEFAVRSWALQSADVAKQISEADDIRLSALRDMFTRFGFDEAASDVRARTVYLTQIGYISMNTREDLAVRMKRIPEYVRIFTGQSPEQRDLMRFYARHDYL